MVMRAERGVVLALAVLLALCQPLAAQIFLPHMPAAPAAPAQIPIPDEPLSLTVLPTVPPTFDVQISQRTGGTLFCEVYIDMDPTGVDFTLADEQATTQTLTDVAAGEHELAVLCVSGSNAQFTANTSVTVVQDPTPLAIVTLTAPSSASSPFNVSLRHSATTNLSCTIGIDMHFASATPSAPFFVGAQEEVKLSVGALTLGTHNITGTCVHEGVNISASKTVVVQNITCQTNASCPAQYVCGAEKICVARNPNITFLAPLDVVRAGTVNVTFRHSALETMYCEITLDDYDWSEDDPRWLNATFTKSMSVAAGTNATATFTGVGVGEHIAHVFCDAQSSEAEEFLAFETSADTTTTTGTQNVAISLWAPLASAPLTGEVVFKHNSTSSATCNVSIDGGANISRTYAPSMFYATVPYAVTAGSHTVIVVCKTSVWSASLTRAFNASNTTLPAITPNTNTTNSTNKTTYVRPVVVVIGTPIAGKPFTVIGDGFPKSSTIDLYITGKGKTVRNSTRADAKGSFSHTWSGMEQGAYSLAAKSASDTSIVATRTFSITLNVSAPPVAPSAPAVNVVGRTQVAPAPQQQRAATPAPQLESAQEGPRLDPGFESPDALTVEEPNDRASVGGWVWFVLVFVVLVGGLGGYLVFTGALDVRSWGGFVQSIEDLKAGTLRAGKTGFRAAQQQDGAIGQGAQQDPHALERDIMRSFIEKERSRGSDDLAIHEALIAQGWERASVDALFDELRR